MDVTDAIHHAADLLRAAQRPCVLTGAGVSRESGIPTFRDALEGLWAQYNPQELATPFAFMENPKLVWDFYEFRRERMRGCAPNPGHHALVALERRFPGLPVITQNVDLLHETAGSTHVLALHGKIHRNKCFFNCQGDPTLVDVSQLDWDKTSGPPPCPHCGRRMVRPDVVWFGELLPSGVLAEANRIVRETDVMLVVGTSGVVQPAAAMPLTAVRHGARLIEVNPYESEISRGADVWVQAPSGEALPRIVELVLKEGAG